MSRQREPVSEEGAYHRVLTGLQGMHQRVHALSSAQLRHRATFAPEILQSFDTVLSSRAAKASGMHRTLIHKNLRSRKERGNFDRGGGEV